MVHLAKVLMHMKSSEDKLEKYFVKKVALLGLGRFALRHDKFHSKCYEIQNIAHFRLVQDLNDYQMLTHVNKRLFGISKPESKKYEKMRHAFLYNVCPIVFANVVTIIRQEMYNFEQFLATQNKLYHIRTDCDSVTILLDKRHKNILENFMKQRKFFSYKLEGNYIQCTNFKRCKYMLVDINGSVIFKCFGLSLSLLNRYCKNVLNINKNCEFQDFIFRSIIARDNSVFCTL